VIIVSPSQRQSGEIFRTVIAYHSNLKDVPELKAASALRAEMANGSRILALPGSETTVRGYSAADLIVIDEAARVEDSLLQAVRPMLATSQGRLVALTTPAGKRGWFYEAWIGDSPWHRVKVPASMCPRISQEFLDEELRELGASRFSEEYQLEFIDPDTAAFPTDIISRCFTTELVIDETGVGRAVGDIFNEAGLKPIKVTITAGNEEAQNGFARFTVPKQILVSTLDAMMHTGELRIAKELRETPALETELKDFRRHVSEAGRYSFQTRIGAHDDLVLAVAIPLWRAVRRKKTFNRPSTPPRVRLGYASAKRRQ
ncbi:MAG: terminase family protein, partial [Pseudolabrys sp.]